MKQTHLLFYIKINGSYVNTNMYVFTNWSSMIKDRVTFIGCALVIPDPSVGREWHVSEMWPAVLLEHQDDVGAEDDRCSSGQSSMTIRIFSRIFRFR